MCTVHLLKHYRQMQAQIAHIDEMTPRRKRIELNELRNKGIEIHNSKLSQEGASLSMLMRANYQISLDNVPILVERKLGRYQG